MMDGKNLLKHVECLTEINKSRKFASCLLCSANILAMHGHMNVKLLGIASAIRIKWEDSQIVSR